MAVEKLVVEFYDDYLVTSLTDVSMDNLKKLHEYLEIKLEQLDKEDKE